VPRIETVTLSDLRTRPAYVSRLARRRRGVIVVDEYGVERFRLWIPGMRMR